MYTYSEDYIKPKYFKDLDGKEQPIEHFIKILTQLAITYFEDELSDKKYSDSYRKKNLFSWCVSIANDYIKNKNTNDVIYLTEEIYKTLSKIDKSTIIKAKMSAEEYQIEKKKFLSKINKKFSENLKILHDAPKEFMDDKEIIITAIKKHSLSLQCASNRLRDDKGFAIFLLNGHKKSSIYSNLSDRLKDDDELIMLAINNDSNNIQYSSDRIKDNEAIVLSAITKNGDNIGYASDRLKANRKLAYAAVSQDGMALKHLSSELQNEDKLVHIAVEKNGWILEHLSDRFKDDKEIVIKACLSKNNVYKHVSQRLKYDNEVAIAALKNDPWAYPYFPYSVRNNREVLKEAVAKMGIMLMYAPINHRWDKEIALIALKSDASVLQGLSLTLKRDKEIILAALNSQSNSLICFQYVSERLRNNKEYLVEIMRNYNIYVDIPERFKEDKELINLALKRNPYTIEKMSNAIKNDKHIIYELLNNYPYLESEFERYIGKELKEAIGNNNPTEYLKNAIAYEQLEKELPHQENKKSKLKI